MFCHLYDYAVWNSCDVSTSKCAVCYMDRISYACSDDLCFDSCYFEDLSDLTDQVNASYGNVIKSSKEWRNICCTSSCSKKCLVSCEDQSNVCFDSF